MRYSNHFLIFLILLLLISMALIFGPTPYSNSNAAEGGYRGTAQDTAGRDVTGRDTTGRDTTQRPAAEPSKYLSNLYIWFLGFVGIAAMFAIVMGGTMYMFAGANLTKTEQAKKWITNAIWGIVLAAVSVLLLRTINPDLVQGFSLETVVNNTIQKIK